MRSYGTLFEHMLRGTFALTEDKRLEITLLGILLM